MKYWLILLLAVVLGRDIAVADSPKKTATKESRVAAPGMESTLTVKSPDGSGSAFLTRLGGRDVIVTNAHVYLAMAAPEICDIDGRKYEITKITASKTRDLVVLSFAGPERPPKSLSVEPDVAKLEVNSPVVAYGGSPGTNAVTAAAGKLNGIGPETIEVDAGFVPGNSGGPVILQKTGNAVGVATSLKVIEPDVTMRGSRYQSAALRPVVRRFAVRLDNLAADDLQEIDPAMLVSDRKQYLLLSQKIDLLAESVKGKFNLEKFGQNLAACCEVLAETEDYRWHSQYLEHEYQSKADLVKQLLETLDLTDLLKVYKIQKVWARNLNDVEIVRIKPFTVGCFNCSGSGRKSCKFDNSAYKQRQAGAPQTVIEYKKCAVCRGEKKVTISNITKIYKLAPELERQLAKFVVRGKNDFAGFAVGGDIAANLEVGNGYYRKSQNLVYRYNNAFGETLLFRGSHASESALATELTVMFGRLVKVEIVFGGAYNDSDIDILLAGLYPGGPDSLNKENYDVVFARSSAIDKIPLDNRGMPLASSRDVNFLETKADWDKNPDFSPMPIYQALTVSAATKSLPVIEKLEK